MRKRGRGGRNPGRALGAQKGDEDASMAYCCVPGCTSYHRRQRESALSFHRFPANPDIRRQWVANIKRDVGSYFQVMSDFATQQPSHVCEINLHVKIHVKAFVFSDH